MILAAAAPAFGATAPSTIFNVRDYGATGDGKTLDTAAINKAVEACAKAGGGTVYVPPGTYYTGTIVLQSNVTLNLEAGATLQTSMSPADFAQVENPWRPGSTSLGPVIWAEDAEKITITGRGTMEGTGEYWWVATAGGLPRPEGVPEVQRGGDRPQFIRLVRCKDVVIQGITLHHSASWNIHPLFCENVKVDGVTIESPARSQNTDGINPDSCKNVQISNCRIDTGDDCVTLKSGVDAVGREVGKPDENIAITNCVMMHGHGGVTIGSEMSGGVHNVVISNCVFQNTDVGIRIKSQRGRGGVVEGVIGVNIVMQDVPDPFQITTYYHGNDKPSDVFPVDEGTPRYHGFLFNNITARGAKNAGSITGLPEMPIEDITFNNVHIDSASGFIVTDAKGITFLDCVINPKQGSPLLLGGKTSEVDDKRLSTASKAPLTGKAPALGVKGAILRSNPATGQ